MIKAWPLQNTKIRQLPLSSLTRDVIPYDPNDPSPTVGGQTLRPDLLQGPQDQRSVEARDDISCAQSEIFDSPLTVFSVSTSDTDIAVRVMDVYPDGRSMLMLDFAQRLRFMNGDYTRAGYKLLTPGQKYEHTFVSPDIALTFLSKHRFRICFSGSNYPRFARNMNTGLEDMYPSNSPDDGTGKWNSKEHQLDPLDSPVTTSINLLDVRVKYTAPA